MWYPNNKIVEDYYYDKELDVFKICFTETADGRRRREIYEFGDLILDILDHRADIEEDAKNFYKHIMINYIPLCHREITEDILSYFKWRGYLKFKKQIITLKYHKKKRYLVKFFDKDKKLSFTKGYTSLRELFDDTGKRAKEITIIPYKKVL